MTSEGDTAMGVGMVILEEGKRCEHVSDAH